MEFIKINYTGKVKDGKVFDTTYAEKAKKHEIFEDSRAYQPLSVAVGEKQVIEGLDEALEGMNVGDKKTVEIGPEKGYGRKKTDMVRLVPIKHFKREGFTPIPGMPVEIDNMRGRVQTVSGGRVRVDFNHELAGKTLVFEIEVVEKAKNDTEKIGYLLERNFAGIEGFKTDIKAKKLGIELPEQAFRDRQLMVRKASMAAEAFKLLGMESVRFVEDWVNPKNEKKTESASSKTKKKQAVD